MSAVDFVRVLRYASQVGWQDFRAQWTWGSWLGGYLTRIAFQIVFFSLIGRLFYSSARVDYLVVGNCLVVGPAIVMLAVQATVAERRLGTLPLLVAAPASVVPVLLGRSTEWLLHGAVVALGSYCVMMPLFHVPVTLLPGAPAIAAMVIVACLSTYGYATCLGALVIRMPESRNLVSTVASLVLMTLAGVNVPSSFFPQPLSTIASVLPVTHGLLAIRAALTGQLAAFAMQAALEALVGLGWFCAGFLAIGLLLRSSRRTVTID